MSEQQDVGNAPGADRPLGATLSNEWHARPQIGLPAPMRCSHLVCLRGNRSVSDSREAFADFCRAHGQGVPGNDSRHHSLEAGSCLVKWEGHTEADSYTLLVSGNSDPLFATSALSFLDATHREQIREGMFVGVHIETLKGSEAPAEERLERVRALLGTASINGGYIAEGKGELWSSFRLDGDGFQRLLLIDHDLGRARLSRYLQRVLELESYRMQAMLALPVARDVMGELSALEPQLDAVMRQLASHADEPAQERQLKTLTNLAAKVEHIVAANSYRFAAARAYMGIVERRIAELGESKVGGAPFYSAFLLKSLLPAMRTCDAAERRTRDFAQRLGRATQLLNSMVDMVQKKQNQEILESMNERSNLQLRLQQSVEGFSIFAISYYAVGMLGYMLKSAKGLGLPADPDILTGLSAPLILAVVWISVRSVRKRLQK